MIVMKPKSLLFVRAGLYRGSRGFWKRPYDRPEGPNRYDNSYGHVKAKRPMGHCFKELEELSEDVPMAEAGESARVRWRETDVKRLGVLSGAGKVVRKAARTLTFMSETK